MKTLTRIAALLFLFAIALTAFAGCGAKKEKVVIWTSGEEYKNEYYLSECRKKFPEYDIELIYMSTAAIAAKVIEEGDRCSADLIISEEYG
ncbi:MAG: hypothetical protein IKP74_00040, partial [Clostridia bacterium]|nr:hypothetical protein [Clostridia bacterium]